MASPSSRAAANRCIRPACDYFSIPAWSSIPDERGNRRGGRGQRSGSETLRGGLDDLAHGRYRANTSALRLPSQSFRDELMADLTVYPYTKETAASWQAGWRATEARFGHLFLRFARRCNSTLARIPGADRKHAPLSAAARSLCRAVPTAAECHHSPSFDFSLFLPR
jgi:hypothetical protein